MAKTLPCTEVTPHFSLLAPIFLLIKHIFPSRYHNMPPPPGGGSPSARVRPDPPPQKYHGTLALVPTTLPPIKRDNRRYSDTNRRLFNRRHGFYRARVEHMIGYLKTWGVAEKRFRSRDKNFLKASILLLASISNVYLSVRLRYRPDP